eukprot:361127-Chlamydomonas_euryale.AAC.1
MRRVSLLLPQLNNRQMRNGKEGTRAGNDKASLGRERRRSKKLGKKSKSNQAKACEHARHPQRDGCA